MDNSDGLIVLVFLALIPSVVIANAAYGRSDGGWGWGLLGPVGWVIAALRGVQVRQDDRAARDDAILVKLKSMRSVLAPTMERQDEDAEATTRPQRLEPRSLAARTELWKAQIVEHPCPSCGKPLRHPRREEGGRVRCDNCGTDEVFGPAHER